MEPTVGRFAMINRKDELFWVLIQEITGEVFKGTVDSELLLTRLHGLKYGDTVEFKKGEVINVYGGFKR
jgi:hypothetical protein